MTNYCINASFTINYIYLLWHIYNLWYRRPNQALSRKMSTLKLIIFRSWAFYAFIYLLIFGFWFSQKSKLTEIKLELFCFMTIALHMKFYIFWSSLQKKRALKIKHFLWDALVFITNQKKRKLVNEIKKCIFTLVIWVPFQNT